MSQLALPKALLFWLDRLLNLKTLHIVENNKYTSFTDEQLLEKQRKNKMASGLFVGMIIMCFIFLCFSFGYYIGADAATGGKGKFHGGYFFAPIFILLIAYFSGKKDREAFEAEVKRRNL
jgi:hypothetical protein